MISYQDFRDALRSGSTSCREEYQALCTAVQAGQNLNAVLGLESDAEAKAVCVDEEIARGEFRPLSGLMIAVKDNISRRDAPLTCGSRMLENVTAVSDATVISRLREAGAVIFARTNLDEFAMGSSTEHSAFGRVLHPMDVSRVPGGSSGGSAVAVAAGLAHAALGSDSGGSIRQPAAFCGVVGIKPTYGRVSRSGLVAFASSFDQIGTFTLTVGDAARILEVIMGPDPMDATTSERAVPTLRTEIGANIAGLRVGIPREFQGQGMEPDIQAALEATILAFRQHGCEIVDIELPHSKFTIPTYQILTTAEASSNLARYDGVRYGFRGADKGNVENMMTESRTLGFGTEVKRRIMLGTYVLSSGYYDAYYRKAQLVRRKIQNDFLRAFDLVDVVLTPTTPTTAFKAGEKFGDPIAMYLSDVLTASANLAGLPAASVPAGKDAAGLPIGMHLMAPPFREDLLIRAASAVESMFPSLLLR